MSRSADELQMESNKGKDHQLWDIMLAESKDHQNSYWIESCHDNNVVCSSSFSSTVKMNNFDKTLSICLWIFEIIEDFRDFGGFHQIIN